MKMKNYKGKILFNLYIPTADGKYTQVDILFISPKGIFVIESKNYSGTIIGNEYDEKWNTKNNYSYDTRYNYNRNKSKENGFYNPVKAIPHKACAEDALSDFSSDCIEVPQAY